MLKKLGIGVVVFILGAFGILGYQTYKVKPEAERILNSSLEALEAKLNNKDRTVFTYKPFKCGGFLFLKCESPFMNLGDTADSLHLMQTIVKVSWLKFNGVSLKFLTDIQIKSHTLGFEKLEPSLPKKLAFDLDLSEAKQESLEWKLAFKGKADFAVYKGDLQGKLVSESLKKQDLKTFLSSPRINLGETKINRFDFEINGEKFDTVLYEMIMQSSYMAHEVESLLPKFIKAKGGLKIDSLGEVVFKFDGNLENTYLNGGTSFEGKVRGVDSKIEDLLSLMVRNYNQFYFTKIDVNMKGKNLASNPAFEIFSKFQKFLPEKVDFTWKVNFQETKNLVNSSTKFFVDADAYRYQSAGDVVFESLNYQKSTSSLEVLQNIVGERMKQILDLKFKAMLESKGLKEKIMSVFELSDAQYQEFLEGAMMGLFAHDLDQQSQKAKEFLDSVQKVVKKFAMGETKRIDLLMQAKQKGDTSGTFNSLEKILEYFKVEIK